MVKDVQLIVRLSLVAVWHREAGSRRSALGSIRLAQSAQHPAKTSKQKARRSSPKALELLPSRSLA